MHSPLNWQSKCIRRIVRSSLAAETLALSDALDDAIYLRKLFSEIMCNDNYDIPIKIIINNKSLYDALFSNKNIIEKCLHIDLALIKENLQKKIITKIHHVPTREELPNVLTKKGTSQKELLKVFQSSTFIQSQSYEMYIECLVTNVSHLEVNKSANINGIILCFSGLLENRITFHLIKEMAWSIEEKNI